MIASVVLLKQSFCSPRCDVNSQSKGNFYILITVINEAVENSGVVFILSYYVRLIG